MKQATVIGRQPGPGQGRQRGCGRKRERKEGLRGGFLGDALYGKGRACVSGSQPGEESGQNVYVIVRWARQLLSCALFFSQSKEKEEQAVSEGAWKRGLSLLGKDVGMCLFDHVISC